MNNIEVCTKLIPTKFVIIGNIEFNYGHLMEVLEQLSETSPNDSFGDYGIKDYYVCDSETMNNLVSLGYAVKYCGERQSTCYKQKDNTTIDELIRKIEELE